MSPAGRVKGRTGCVFADYVYTDVRTSLSLRVTETDVYYRVNNLLFSPAVQHKAR